MNLPPGFRFCPTDEELVVHFLHRKAALLPCHPDVIPDLDLYPYDPWDLDGKAMAGGNKKWYFYSRKTARRMTRNGHWAALGVDEPIIAAAATAATNSNQKIVGLKKYYVFCVNGGEPNGEDNGSNKTNWIMQEFRLPADHGSSSSKRLLGSRSKSTDYSKWVLCRVYDQSCNGDEDEEEEEEDNGTELSSLDEVFLSLDDLDEISNWPHY